MAKPGSVKIVSNTGPIIGLAKIRQLGLLFEELRENGYWLSDEVIRISKKLAKE